MQVSQLNFYNRLSANEQTILKAAALKAIFYYVSDIQDLLMYRVKVTQKGIKDCLDEAVKYDLFENSNGSYRSQCDYKVTVDFMLFIFPQMDDFDLEWKIVSKDGLHSYYSNKNLLFTRDFVFSLLHDSKRFIHVQPLFLSNVDYQGILQLTPLLDNKLYNNLISLIDFEVVKTIVLAKYNTMLMALKSFNEIELYFENIVKLIAPENRPHIPSVESTKCFHTGQYERLINPQIIDESFYYLSAILNVIKVDFKQALADFDKGIKLERYEYKNLQVPSNLFYSFFFFSTLACTEQELAAVRAQKILKVIEKNSYSNYDDFFKSILHNILNNLSARKASLDFMLNYISKEYKDLQSLLFICICYLSDAKPALSIQNAMLNTIKHAKVGGYLTISYEAAFAVKKWFNSVESITLFSEVESNMNYKPIFSNVARQEEWEKTLNLLLTMDLGTKKGSDKAKDNENKSRVVYYFSDQHHDVNPVLQTRTAKGAWSSGRKIAMKTFFAANGPGMTEQDNRIAKTIKRYSNYYGSDDYEFTPKTIVELIGHPYVFLRGSNDIPVELIAAKPEVTVKKTSTGYTLKSDIESTHESVLVVKETNTRYKVYEITPQQRNIINILEQQRIVVPEQGKDKLVELLGGFSKHVTVHSDLLATDNQRVKVKEVKPDNKIRVQLLPFGDGLKAELFCKPFGTHPPYCKPGIGGKVLIAQEEDTQLQVKRNLKQEIEYANALLADFQSLESIDMSEDLISFDEPLDSLHLLDIISDHKDKCIVEWPEGERFRIRATASFANLSLTVKSKTNWFELDGELKVDEDTVITLQQLMGLMTKSHDRFIELQDGEFLALSAEMKRRLEELQAYTTKSRNGLQMNKFASMAMGDFFDEVQDLKVDKAWKEFKERIDLSDIEQIAIPAALQADLRPYQEEGFRWMARLAEWEGGACLADDMGLGKTIQTLTVLLHRAPVGPALVVCPVSVVGNWMAEAMRFAPTLNVKTLGAGNRKETMEQLEAGDLLITSYGLLQSEDKLFIEKEFATVVLDEAHIIKNFATKTSKVTMQLKASFRVALTGTPLQNHLGEIWNLFNFINPGLLGTLQQFNDSFVKPDREIVRKQLRKLIAPFILRRTKSAVLDELPPKTEIVKKIQLSDAEMAFYEALRRQAIHNIEVGEGANGAKHLQVLAEITRLRQASCNPMLVDASVNIPSSKLSTFLEIVDELIENKHRALVFSQFVSHLSIVRDALDKKGINYQYLDGSTSMAERERSVKRFQGGEGELFLISLKAGGLGLNLTAADYVIHMDPWWNPAIEDQASDRAHRIGQSRPVTIYRLVAENTIEEKIIQLHNTKRDLADSLLEGSDKSARMSITELVSLIQEGY